ncbi:MAG: hypothetical protein ACOY3N_09565 [Bradyrhizobium sp.]|uniref:hypothetical protein n=1 Tax=Bradyrhizobium sp. TaxID=376 RepID=UPI003BF3DF37
MMPWVDEAFRAFDRWRAEHDPDCEMDILEAAAAYSDWASTNSIEKYLDAAQHPPQVRAPE